MPDIRNPQQECEIQWLVSARQAAQIMNISQRSVRSMMANGDFELCRIGGSVRIWLDDLLRFCKQHSIPIPKPEAATK